MKLYIYAENTTMKGHIVPESKWQDDENCDDWFLFSEGTEEEVVAEARRQLIIKNDARPGGAGDAFRHKCARNVLEYFNAEMFDGDDDMSNDRMTLASICDIGNTSKTFTLGTTATPVLCDGRKIGFIDHLQKPWPSGKKYEGYVLINPDECPAGMEAEARYAAVGVFASLQGALAVIKAEYSGESLTQKQFNDLTELAE